VCTTRSKEGAIERLIKQEGTAERGVIGEGTTGEREGKDGRCD
jgi:hypothetical protein